MDSSNNNKINISEVNYSVAQQWKASTIKINKVIQK